MDIVNLGRKGSFFDTGKISNSAPKIFKKKKRAQVSNESKAESTPLVYRVVGGGKGSKKVGSAALSKKIMDAINNKKFVKKSAKKKLHLVTGDKYINNKQKKGNRTKKNPFVKFIGTTSQAISEFSKKYHGNEIAGTIYADSTSIGGGYLYTGNAQEEHVVRDMSPVTICHLLGQKLVSKNSNNKNADLEYLKPSDYLIARKKGKKGKKALAPFAGYMIDSKLDYTDEVKNKKPIKFRALFAALPDLTGQDKYSIILSRYLYGGKTGMETTEEENLLQALCDSRASMSSDEFKRALKIFMCRDIYRFANPAAKFLTDMKNFAKSEAGYNNVCRVAESGYAEMIRKAIRTWIVMARENGIKCFIGGPIGCGVFGNDIHLVAQTFAEEFVEHGGEMEFIYPALSKETSQIFESAFKEAFKEKK